MLVVQWHNRRVSVATTIVLGCAVAGCTLPYEQLSVPGPINGSIKPASHGNSKPGAPLSASASAPTEHRSFEGSGDFTNKVTQKIAGSGSGSVSGSNGDGRASAPPSEVTKDGITLNLVGASVAEVAKTVLGDVLGVNFTVSDKVKATITLRTSKPVEKAGLLSIFESVLREEGAAILVEGDLYKIVPSADATAAGAPLRPHRAGQQTAGIATDIVPLRFVAAAEMERILKSAAPQASILRADSARNLLILSGTRAELNSMGEMINVFDVDWMKGMSFGIYPIETSDPEAIAQELDTIFANDKDGPSKGLVRFVPNRRLKSIMVISSRPEYLKKAETWLTRIDLASKATDKQVNVYHVQHRPAGELATLLQKVYQSRGGSGTGQSSSGRTGGAAGSADGIGPAAGGSGTGSTGGGANPAGFGSAGGGGTPGGATTPASGGSTVGSPSPAQPATSSPDTAVTAPGAPAADGLTTGSIDTGKTAGGGGLPPDDRGSGISVVADEIKNSLIITATAAEYRRVKQVLSRIDIEANQILLEATIAEVTLNDNLKFGVRWFIKNGSNGGGQRLNSTVADGGLLTLPITAAANPAVAGFQYFLNAANFQAVLNALSSVTHVDTISSPSLMVTENKRATLQVGNDVPITTQTAVGVQVVGAPIVNSITYRSVGVILGITPRLSEDNRVFLEIEQEVSDVASGAAGTTPVIQQRRVKTTVTVNDGETIVLAGMMQDKASRIRDQLPLIGDIPLFGNAFKNKDDEISRTELLISITPHVVRDRQQIDDVTAEYRDHLNLSTRPQRRGPPDHREQLDRIIR